MSMSEAGGVPIKHIRTFFASTKKGTSSPVSFNRSQPQSVFCFPGKERILGREKQRLSSGTQQGECQDARQRTRAAGQGRSRPGGDLRGLERPFPVLWVPKRDPVWPNLPVIQAKPELGFFSDIA